MPFKLPFYRWRVQCVQCIDVREIRFTEVATGKHNT